MRLDGSASLLLADRRRQSAEARNEDVEADQQHPGREDEDDPEGLCEDERQEQPDRGGEELSPLPFH
jgi:hypothetical protein